MRRLEAIANRRREASGLAWEHTQLGPGHAAIHHAGDGAIVYADCKVATLETIHGHNDAHRDIPEWDTARMEGNMRFIAAAPDDVTFLLHVAAAAERYATFPSYVYRMQLKALLEAQEPAPDNPVL